MIHGRASRAAEDARREPEILVRGMTDAGGSLVMTDRMRDGCLLVDRRR